MAIAPLALSDLGDDVGIDQVIHSLTSRPTSRLRLRSMPSRGAETSSAFRPVALLAPKCSCNSVRVSNSRLGFESAVTTPRTRAASSFRTWTSRRTTPRRFRRCRNSDRDFFFWRIGMIDLALASGNVSGNYGKNTSSSNSAVFDWRQIQKPNCPPILTYTPCDLIRSAAVVFIDENGEKLLHPQSDQFRHFIHFHASAICIFKSERTGFQPSST